MALKDDTNNAIKEAMKAKDQARLRGLRAIKAALLNLESEAGKGAEITQEQELKTLEKLVKQRRDSVAQYKEAGREDLAEKEQEEIDVINEFLPAQLTEDELKQELQTLIDDLQATGPKDMGRVMKEATVRLVGRAEGKTISRQVKELLGA